MALTTSEQEYFNDLMQYVSQNSARNRALIGSDTGSIVQSHQDQLGRKLELMQRSMDKKNQIGSSLSDPVYVEIAKDNNDGRDDDNLVRRLSKQTFNVRITDTIRTLVDPLFKRMQYMEALRRKFDEELHYEDTVYFRNMITAILSNNRGNRDLISKLQVKYLEFMRHPIWNSLVGLMKTTVVPMAKLVSGVIFGFKKRKTDTDRIVDSINRIYEFLRTGKVQGKGFFSRMLSGGLVGLLGSGVGALAGVGRGVSQKAEEKRSEGGKLSVREKIASTLFKDVDRFKVKGAGDRSQEQMVEKLTRIVDGVASVDTNTSRLNGIVGVTLRSPVTIDGEFVERFRDQNRLVQDLNNIQTVQATYVRNHDKALSNEREKFNQTLIEKIKKTESNTAHTKKYTKESAKWLHRLRQGQFWQTVVSAVGSIFRGVTSVLSGIASTLGGIIGGIGTLVALMRAKTMAGGIGDALDGPNRKGRGKGKNPPASGKKGIFKKILSGVGTVGLRSAATVGTAAGGAFIGGMTYSEKLGDGSMQGLTPEQMQEKMSQRGLSPYSQMKTPETGGLIAPPETKKQKESTNNFSSGINKPKPNQVTGVPFINAEKRRKESKSDEGNFIIPTVNNTPNKTVESPVMKQVSSMLKKQQQQQKQASVSSSDDFDRRVKSVEKSSVDQLSIDIKNMYERLIKSKDWGEELVKAQQENNSKIQQVVDELKNQSKKAASTDASPSLDFDIFNRITR